LTTSVSCEETELWVSMRFSRSSRLLERLLRARQVAPRDFQLEAVPAQVVLDASELDVREVVRLDRFLQAGVESLELAHHLLGLSFLLRDGGGVGLCRRGGYEQDCYDGDGVGRRPTLTESQDYLRSPGIKQGAPGEGRYVTSTAP
jgi:hypothetical protein